MRDLKLIEKRIALLMEAGYTLEQAKKIVLGK